LPRFNLDACQPRKVDVQRGRSKENANGRPWIRLESSDSSAAREQALKSSAWLGWFETVGEAMARAPSALSSLLLFLPPSFRRGFLVPVSVLITLRCDERHDRSAITILSRESVVHRQIQDSPRGSLKAELRQLTTDNNRSNKLMIVDVRRTDSPLAGLAAIDGA